MIVEKRLGGAVGRDYIERISAQDARYGINSKGALAEQNAYGEIVDVQDDGNEYPVICGHGGSMWLCRACKEALLGRGPFPDKPLMPYLCDAAAESQPEEKK